MRWFLVALVLLAPVVVANPIFWWLVQSAFSAAPATYVEADGRVQHALLGPKSHWPDWALTPDGAKLTVEAWFAATPPAPETGFGTLNFKGEATTAVRDFVGKLEAAGWKVETSRSDTVDPTLPPRAFQMCQLRASRADGSPRIMTVSIPIGYSGRSARQQWWSSPPPQYSHWPALSGPAC
ncbi:MAG: hypothetical protein R3D44_09505 [Hyphomicrobiaceae bacterium]